MEMNYASKGVANAGLATGIIGTSLGATCLSSCYFFNDTATTEIYTLSLHDALPIYELAQERKIAELQSQIALRDANTYGDQKMLEMYKYIDGKLSAIDTKFCEQAVHNQRTEDSFTLARQDIASVRSELDQKIKLEAERRCCGDNSIVTYANATFYPKMVADVTVGTATTAQTLYNPLPKCGCDCNS